MLITQCIRKWRYGDGEICLHRCCDFVSDGHRQPNYRFDTVFDRKDCVLPIGFDGVSPSIFFILRQLRLDIDRPLTSLERLPVDLIPLSG